MNELHAKVTEKEFDVLLRTLDAMFEENCKPNAIGYKKAGLTFKHMENWTIEEFENTLQRFIQTHADLNWMPADILKIHEMLYGNESIN